MEKYYCSIFKKKDTAMGTLVCVKQVKQEVADKWNESMPLPGDIIEGIANHNVNPAAAAEELFITAKGRSDFSSQLGKISKQAEAVWMRVRRGDSAIKLRVCIVPDRSSKMQKRFTVRAASDEKHVAVLADLTSDECTELQEMSRRLVNVDWKGFNQKEVKYDWKMKVDMYLPDQRSTVVSSTLFMPLASEHHIEPTTVRVMAWFNAAVSSGVPLVFVNIQTEQIITSEKTNVPGKDISWGRQQNYTTTTTFQIVQGIRLWYLPGISEVALELSPQKGESRFGMDIKRTDEGFVCVYAVTNGTAADRAGLRYLYEQANITGHLLVLSRLEGKSLMPSTTSSAGIHCCDHADIKETLTSAMDQMESIQIHVMSWPSQNPRDAPQLAIGAANLRPPC